MEAFPLPVIVSTAVIPTRATYVISSHTNTCPVLISTHSNTCCLSYLQAPSSRAVDCQAPGHGHELDVHPGGPASVSAALAGRRSRRQPDPDPNPESRSPQPSARCSDCYSAAHHTPAFVDERGLAHVVVHRCACRSAGVLCVWPLPVIRHVPVVLSLWQTAEGSAAAQNDDRKGGRNPAATGGYDTGTAATQLYCGDDPQHWTFIFLLQA